MNKKLFFAGILLLCLMAGAGLISAGEQFEGFLSSEQNAAEEIKGVLGLGVLISTPPYEGVDENVFPVPIAVLTYKNFFVDGTAFGYHLINQEGFQFSVLGQPRLMGYDSDDSTKLNGMEDRDPTLDGGLGLGWLNEWFELDITAVTDLGGTHEGQEISAVFSKELFEGFLTPRVGVKWQSEGLVDYYYGVRAAEVAAGRPEYEPDSAVNFIVGLSVGVPIGGDKWAFVFDFEYEGLNSEISDSPIVDEDGIFSYVAGVVYRF